MDFDNNIPIYIQIEKEIKINIISGKLKPKDKLPSVRDLAIDLRVNPNTIQKALAMLEEEGLIYTERTNGKYVTDDTKLIEKTKNNLAKSLVDIYLSSMEEIGISRKDSIKYLKEEEK